MTRAWQTRAGLLAGTAVLAAGLFQLAGGVGVALAGVAAVVVAVGRPPFGVATAQVAVGALASPTSPGVVVAEGGVVVLLAVTLASRVPRRWAVGGLAVAGGVAGVGIAALRADLSLAATAVAVVVAGSVVLYVGHRYERVALGLVELEA